MSDPFNRHKKTHFTQAFGSNRKKITKQIDNQKISLPVYCGVTGLLMDR